MNGSETNVMNRCLRIVSYQCAYEESSAKKTKQTKKYNVKTTQHFPIV